MNSVPLSSAPVVLFVGAMFLVQAVAWVALSAVGAWIAIRFEKWREGRA